MYLHSAVVHALAGASSGALPIWQRGRPDDRRDCWWHRSRCIGVQGCNVRYSADEHAQTSVSEHGDRHSPRLAGGPDGAEAARRVAPGGRAATCRQNPSSRGRGADGLCLGAASLHPGHLRGIGPRTENLEGPRSPETEQPGIRALRIGLPARQWRLRDACSLSRRNDFLAL
jgi:hypothetical protein